MAGAAVVRCQLDLRSSKSLRRNQLGGGASASQHSHRPASRDQRRDDPREDGDAEPARDTDDATLAVEVEASTERTDEIELVSRLACGQPGAASSDDVENEANPAARVVDPGGAIWPAQQGHRRPYGNLKNLARPDCGRRSRVRYKQLHRSAYRAR